MSETGSPFKEALAETVKDTSRELDELPLAIANTVRAETSLEPSQKQQALQLIRAWVDYAHEHDVSHEDPYLLRAHLEDFAAQRFNVDSDQRERITNQELLHIPVDSITTPEGESMLPMLAEVTDPAIVKDYRVIVYGGTARAVLKAYALQREGGDAASYRAELPISDVDLMVVGSEDAQQIAEHYGSDLGGTKIVPNAAEAITSYFNAVDVTMNQVMLHDGELIFTQQAYDDICNGRIRATGCDKPLFGRDTILGPDGNVYLMGGGFYRTLSMLLRGRGQEVEVSKENLEAEKDEIGRYWGVLLMVKLMKMAPGDRQNEAILQWSQVARDIGSTETNSPAEFFNELTHEYEDFFTDKKTNAFDLQAQTRWIISKLVHRGRKQVENQPPMELPSTYTPAPIILRPYEGDREHDVVNFWTAYNTFMEGVGGQKP